MKEGKSIDVVYRGPLGRVADALFNRNGQYAAFVKRGDVQAYMPIPDEDIKIRVDGDHPVELDATLKVLVGSCGYDPLKVRLVGPAPGMIDALVKNFTTETIMKNAKEDYEAHVRSHEILNRIRK